MNMPEGCHDLASLLPVLHNFLLVYYVERISGEREALLDRLVQHSMFLKKESNGSSLV